MMRFFTESIQIDAFSFFTEATMVLMINGVPLEEAPRDVPAFISQYPHFKESASRLCSMKPESMGPHGLIYVFAREFDVTHPHDNKISVMGTDDITTRHVLHVQLTRLDPNRPIKMNFRDLSCGKFRFLTFFMYENLILSKCVNLNVVTF